MSRRKVRDDLRNEAYFSYAGLAERSQAVTKVERNGTDGRFSTAC